MSFLNAVINKVKDEALREQLQERIDIIRHKIKFMDKVPVACLDTHNKVNYALEELILAAGGLLHDFIDTAKVVIYMERGRTMLELMGIVPPLLEKTWPAVAYNRVYLMNGQDLDLDDAEDLVTLLEDVAEMLHPGSFVFGNEGIDWLSFKTQ
ncbi:hypothetical protein D3C87_1321570 [compost metagenome]